MAWRQVRFRNEKAMIGNENKWQIMAVIIRLRPQNQIENSRVKHRQFFKYFLSHKQLLKTKLLNHVYFLYSSLLSVDDPAFAPSAFSYFRVLMTGKNSHSHWYLALSGFELFGDVWSALPSPALLSSDMAASASSVVPSSSSAASSSVSSASLVALDAASQRRKTRALFGVSEYSSDEDDVLISSSDDDESDDDDEDDEEDEDMVEVEDSDTDTAAAGSSASSFSVEELSASGAPLRWRTFTPAFASSASSSSALPSTTAGPSVVSSADMDACGLLYWLGVQGDASSHAWDNPAAPAGLNAVRVAFAPPLQST
jgi:hypothetical protein